MSVGASTLLAAVLVVASLLAMAQAMLRLHAIRSLQASGQFEKFGKPRRFVWLDPLPARLFFGEGRFDHEERRFFRLYFATWVGAWVAFAIYIYGSIVTQP